MGRFLFTLLLVLIAIRVARRLLAQASRGRVRVPGEETIDDDPYAVLGVPRGASPDEITRAYREQMKRYHPDRVADLGDELQQVAHRKTLAIQRAYDTIGKR
jgi:DnaJ-domain-containing protein 1